MEEPDELADGVVAVLRVAERELLVHLVAVPAALPDLRQVARLLEVGDDLCRRPFRDTDGRCDVPQSSGRVASDGFEHMRVIRDESPPVVLAGKARRAHVYLGERRVLERRDEECALGDGSKAGVGVAGNAAEHVALVRDELDTLTVSGT